MTKRKDQIKLGHPSKMPGPSWGISALRCKTGSKLAQIEGTICASCYALSGHYRYPNVLACHESRLARYNEDRKKWVDDMACAIVFECAKSRDNRFRWFDAGDLQSADMLRDIAEVCRKTPKIRHWLPTKEYQFVKEFMESAESVPNNLCIRLSAFKVDQKAPSHWGLPGSGVVSDIEKSNCQAYKNETVNCLDCDKCWSKSVKAVYYPLH